MRSTADGVQVVLDWDVLGGPHVVGTLHVEEARGTPVFSFEYDTTWLQDHRGVALDPDLAMVGGRTWPRPEQPNFGIFLDTSGRTKPSTSPLTCEVVSHILIVGRRDEGQKAALGPG